MIISKLIMHLNLFYIKFNPDKIIKNFLILIFFK